MYIYVSSYSPSASFPDCQPPHDGISVIKVPRKAPQKAAVVNFPVLFPDGGNPGAPTNPGVSATTGCHDITVLPSKDLAAGACMGDGILFDIKNPERPKVIDRVQDNVNFAFWHSATFNQDANKVVFTDELGGGGAATCNEAIGPNRGADGIYDIVGKGDHRKLVFRSYYKIPRHQASTENCVAHNGSLIPVKGRDIMVQAWYQGGVSVWDFTNSSKPKEIAYFERGPISADQPRARRFLVGVLLQRLHLLERHRQGLRRAEAQRPPDGRRRSRCGWTSSTSRRSLTTSTTSDRPTEAGDRWPADRPFRRAALRPAEHPVPTPARSV